ncbi:thioesterase II family protein [Streptacidiphilus sp. EB103A]|uniref:thioesterase II family protein n=1 Tax=Streptacidiphilus sp. EB103A TaxID=3156275 RepID=UPI0035172F6E
MTDPVLDDVWIRRFHSAADQAPTLVCFPHAGGSASYFRPWSEALAPRVQALAVQYPGRQDRLHHPRLTSVADFADEAFIALEPLMDRPLALFGHSMGAMIAFELGLRMRSRLGMEPSALFVSARRAPSAGKPDGAVHLLPDDQLVTHLHHLSGTDSRILDDESVLRMILPPMRSDYQAIETYLYRPGPPLGCPVVVLVGDDDGTITPSEARSWEAHTTGPFALHVFSGGHFYLAEHQQALADLVTRELLPQSV